MTVATFLAAGLFVAASVSLTLLVVAAVAVLIDRLTTLPDAHDPHTTTADTRGTRDLT
jgi:hypothetical protein